MFTLTPQEALLIGFIVAPNLFALCAYFTRANVRRIAGALVGAAAYGAINYGLDQAENEIYLGISDSMSRWIKACL